MPIRSANITSAVQHLTPKRVSSGWLRFADHYRYIRLLYQQDRITIVPGDMLKDKSMRSIAKSARAIGVPIRVYYPSNAEEFWDYSTNNSNYKKNILSLPFDEASITFRSVHEYPWHPAHRKGFKGFWHYVIHGAYNYRKSCCCRTMTTWTTSKCTAS